MEIKYSDRHNKSPGWAPQNPWFIKEGRVKLSFGNRKIYFSHDVMEAMHCKTFQIFLYLKAVRKELVVPPCAVCLCSNKQTNKQPCKQTNNSQFPLLTCCCLTPPIFLLPAAGKLHFEDQEEKTSSVFQGTHLYIFAGLFLRAFWIWPA